MILLSNALSNQETIKATVEGGGKTAGEATKCCMEVYGRLRSKVLKRKGLDEPNFETLKYERGHYFDAKKFTNQGASKMRMQAKQNAWGPPRGLVIA
eukprot:6190546-Pleurochrysis_carterae.AAC.1